MTNQLTLADGVRVFAEASPEKVCATDDSRDMTYAELGRRSARVANALLEIVPEGCTRVGVMLTNRLECLELITGLAKSGLTLVPLSPRLTEPEIRYIVEHSGCGLIITQLSLRDLARSVLDVPTLNRVLVMDSDDEDSYERLLAGAPTTDPDLAVSEQEPCVILYTSGTTGRPKGVVISHRARALLANCVALEYGLGPQGRTICTVPLYHGAGYTFGYSAVQTGGFVAIMPKFGAEELLRQIQDHGVTTLFLVPTQLHSLQQLPAETLVSYDLSALRTIYLGAAPLSPELKAWGERTWPHVGFHEHYGSTELGIATNLRPELSRDHPGSVGPVWMMNELRILDADRSPLPVGTPGEIYARSPFLMSGYLDDPESTAACTTDDGFVTAGDIGRLDEKGLLFLVGRSKDMIVSGGLNVYSREVEAVLDLHPDVVESGVLSAPSDHWGEMVVAVVVPVEGRTPTPAALEEHCRTALAGYKVPRHFVFATEMPKTPTGKIIKSQLRGVYETAAEKSTAEAP
ncbi:MAG: AMP-binding protein [Nocardioidaceae bacterium]